ncbi:hypothetical protein GBAR_LOCUS1950 [Geodia barretti]|uniref:Uncharacterized protein n=1 Tax=Geodia barretti TaxID=519541 RepID=A0AA35QYV8_GEOBA|nr:hypothetical protein GBAR_LOCUS1950 [Geodia barretti]
MQNMAKHRHWTWVECKTEEEPMEGRERETLFLGDGLVGESWLG